MSEATVEGDPTGTPMHAGSSVNAGLVTVAAVGAAVAVFLGVYANVHDPTGEAPYQLFFTGTINLKVWFATGGFVLAVVQVLSASWLYGKLGGDAPDWLGDVHRLSGTVAFALTLPVAYHCLWSIGFQDGDTRVLVHSIVGCFFYGVFATKVLAVRNHDLPGWVLPVVGGTTFTALTLLWLTSSVWFWTEIEFPGF